MIIIGAVMIWGLLLVILGLEVANRRCPSVNERGNFSCMQVAVETLGQDREWDLSVTEMPADWREVIEKRVFEVERKEISGFNGVACFDYAFVAADLPTAAKRYVTAHEALHLVDYRLSETQVNWKAAGREPLGMMQTVFYSVYLGVRQAGKQPVASWPCWAGRMWVVFKVYFLGGNWT